jgi:hypothetical protein
MDDKQTNVEELQHFVAKWYAREPEMQWAEVFCPASQKSIFHVWGAFQNEIRHTLFELSDAHVTEVKSAWWADECQRMVHRQGRHPLSQVLQAYDADWLSLASSMLELNANTMRATNADAAIEQLMPISSSLQRIEAVLFVNGVDQAVAKSIATSLLLQRIPHGLAMEDQARIPMHLVARHGVNGSDLAKLSLEHALLKDWAQELQAQLPLSFVDAPVFRKVRLRFDHARLVKLASGNGSSPPYAVSYLWHAWRAARS